MKKRIYSFIITIVIICGSIFIPLSAQAYDANQQNVNDNEWSLLLMTNKVRASENIAPLTTFANLNKAADVRAKEIKTKFSHTRPDGKEFNTALQSNGISYSYAGENISAGQSTAKAACSAFYNSEGHRRNMLNENYSHMGVGYYECNSDYWYYWTELYTGKSTYTEIWVENKLDKDFAIGTTLDEIEASQAYVVAAKTDKGQVCYMPLITELCTGYDAANSHMQSVKVKAFGKETELKIDLVGGSCDVTYVDWDGSVIMTETVAYGEAAVAPEAPTRANFEFVGWSVDGKNIQNDTVIKALYKADFMLGDANGNGAVNTADAVSILRACADNTKLSELSFLESDCNFDNVINTADAVEILRMCAG